MLESHAPQFTAIGSLNHAHHLTHPRVRVVAIDTELSLINEELVKRVVCILDPACPVEDRQVHQKVRSNSNHRARSCELLPVATSIYIFLSRSDNRRVQGREPLLFAVWTGSRAGNFSAHQGPLGTAACGALREVRSYLRGEVKLRSMSLLTDNDARNDWARLPDTMC